MFGLAVPWSAVVGAAVIDPELEAAMQTGAEVAFIAQFSERVDLNAFPGQGQGRGMRLAALLWALRNLADASQDSAVALLKAGGATRIIKLWSINALAATASPDLVRELAALPEVETIKLDATLAAPGPAPAASAPSGVEPGGRPGPGGVGPRADRSGKRRRRNGYRRRRLPPGPRRSLACWVQ
jgi:hypothetical protein